MNKERRIVVALLFAIALGIYLGTYLVAGVYTYG